MHRNLFDCVNIDPAKTNLPDDTNPDAADACAKYNAIIHSVGGIDLQLLGLGLNGHIGFNEPGEAFLPETHLLISYYIANFPLRQWARHARGRMFIH